MNPNKGEVELVVGGVPYTLRFSMDAICATEEKSGKGFPALLTAFGADPSFVLLRVLLWGALRDQHPDVTLKQAGELIMPAGGMDVVMTIVFEAVNRAKPAEESGGDNPPKPSET